MLKKFLKLQFFFFLNKKAKNGGWPKVNWIEMTGVGRDFYLGGGSGARATGSWKKKHK